MANLQLLKAFDVLQVDISNLLFSSGECHRAKIILFLLLHMCLWNLINCTNFIAKKLLIEHGLVKFSNIYIHISTTIECADYMYLNFGSVPGSMLSVLNWCYPKYFLVFCSCTLYKCIFKISVLQMSNLAIINYENTWMICVEFQEIKKSTWFRCLKQMYVA